MIITKKDWDNSGLDFDKLVKILVDNQYPVEIDQDLWDYFGEVVPPFRSLPNSFLMGEAIDMTKDYELTYDLFVRRDDRYWYYGPKTEPEYEKFIRGKTLFKGRLSVSGGWVVDEFINSNSRAVYNYLLRQHKGWYQHSTSQDEHYFGFFVNSELKQLATYAEGDLSIVYHVNPVWFEREYFRATRFYLEL